MSTGKMETKESKIKIPGPVVTGIISETSENQEQAQNLNDLNDRPRLKAAK